MATDNVKKLKTVKVVIEFNGKGYIADPYWPARAKLIDIQKGSGLNRAKSDAARRKSLDEYLQRTGMTLAQYQQLEADASAPFYKNAKGKIIIPPEQFLSFLVATCDTVRSAQKPCSPEQVRSRFDASEFTTDKDAADGIWERFALVASGTGQKLSNQRGLRKSEYIRDFEAKGTLTFDENFVDAKTLHNALILGGQDVGIGASRKMGYGRFTVKSFT
jgi:hypothetical protein